ncbi:sulfurtransferase [Xylophilus rhododendri]|uniref:tRNA uridine(34) hydroxylase n=1 Tax=Xylophilus rhododendri TaxID=2697032 RepID=A0A857JDU3_9BURK|nr:sulfurtransferase [Xylophilus rhododendri]QHJ00846.1 sulfurtransferase [Xylophilus rhododendri]
MNSILNISAYRFIALPDAEALRQPLLDRALALGLRGTILLAGEGINLFLAGPAEDVHRFLDDLRLDPRFAGLEAKESWSDRQPFGRMMVKVKPEIIRMNHPAIRPQAGRAPAVDSATLRRWLDAGQDDEGREVVLLDTRNAFEVDHGAFEGAIDWRIEKFTEFPAALREHREEFAGKTVVSYCTGGIRCEKGAILMAEEGLEHVYQLEGGILKYFEEQGGAHYRGGCFVFDDRRVLDASLAAPAAAPSSD